MPSVIIESPTSYTGSARRIWLLLGTSTGWARAALGACALVLIAGAWCLVTAWYLMWGLLLVPWRLVRRGGRKRKLEAQRHAELMAAARVRR